MGLDDTIANVKDIQDIELIQVFNELKNKPSGELLNFLNSQQEKVFTKVTQQKDDTFNKVSGDLERSRHVQETLLELNRKSNEISQLHDNIYNNQKETADSVVNNKNTFGRKYEMNEWSVNNKKDTLFVFSSLFVIISVLLLLTALLRLNYISTGVWGFIGAIGIVVFILIVVNRAQYTDILRNKHYWNKKQFEGKYGTIPVPSVCPDPPVCPDPLGSPGLGSVGRSGSI
jgi:hypothetical protein